jgi:hypothetical protein
MARGNAPQLGATDMAAFTQVDFPHFRSKLACPACNRAKDKGTLVCWPCYRVLDMRHGMRPDIAARFDALETFFYACDIHERAESERAASIGRVSFKSCAVRAK